MKTPHPFFHTMVVVSAGLVGCGGATDPALGTDEPGDSTDDDNPDDTTPSGSGGATTGSGGSDQGSGGWDPGLPGTGGATPPEVVELPALDCPPELWTCTADQTLEYHYVEMEGGEYVDGYEMPADCVCDPARPNSPDDCELGEQFTCWRMSFLDENHAFDQTYMLSCECVPDANTEYCGDECEAHSLEYPWPGDGVYCDNEANPALTLCGASFVYLK